MRKTWIRLALGCFILLAGFNTAPSQEPAAPAKEPAVEVEKPAPAADSPAPTPPKPAAPRSKSSRVRIHRTSPGSHVVIGDDLVLKEDEVASDVVVIGGSAFIDGKVTEGLVVLMGGAKLGPKAEVRRDVTVIGGGLEADPGAKMGPSRLVLGAPVPGMGKAAWLRWPSQWLSSALMHGRMLPHQYWWSWAMAGLAFVFYVILAVLFPRQVQVVVHTLEERPGNAWLTGLLAAMLLGPLLMLLAISVIGLVVIPVAVAGFILAFVFGKVAVCRYAGQQIGSQIGSACLQQPLPALFCGALLLCALYVIPMVGLLAWCAAAPLGLGAVVLTMFQSKPRPAAAAASPMPPGPSGAPGDVGLGVAVPAGSGTVEAQTAPRAGFWIRLLAALLDLLLVGVLAAVWFHGVRWFILLWLLYHLVFWSWRGTTIGGMALGLKVVRTDGQPMNFAVALVRLFASLFSLDAAGLGFFWAGWSRDKQSWHDKIAGTVIVKARGT
jgi:uncharacterized RDD family membrane protein YckC